MAEVAVPEKLFRSMLEFTAWGGHARGRRKAGIV